MEKRGRGKEERGHRDGERRERLDDSRKSGSACPHPNPANYHEAARILVLVQGHTALNLVAPGPHPPHSC